MTLQHRILPEQRRKALKQMLSAKSGIRIIEAHNGLSALIGTTTHVNADGEDRHFDGLWVSSLTDSAAKGHPDTEVIDTSSRLATIQSILQVSDLPVIVDGDTGGEPTQFEYFCSKLENMGVSAVVIEDKQYPKRNSLEKDATHILESPEAFATKVNRAKAVCVSNDFMIFTRIESFIAGRGLDDAIHRASIYLDSDADGIFIHSNQDAPDQIYAFMEAYQALCHEKGFTKPVICVPTTYNQVTDEVLFDHGFNIVIYANHLLRAAYKAMKATCESILTHRRSHDCLDDIATVKTVMNEVGFPEVRKKDGIYRKKPIPVILLASGRPTGFVGTEYDETPIGAIELSGKTLLSRQMAALKALGLNDLTYVSGYQHDKLPRLDINIIHNDRFDATKAVDSLMLVIDRCEAGFVMIFGDIVFDASLLENALLKTPGDVVLLVDNAFNLSSRTQVKPTADLVMLSEEAVANLRKPNKITEKVSNIGKTVPVDKATHEFVGIAKFSAKGVQQIQEAYKAIKARQGEDSPIGFNTLIKTMIASGHDVEAMEINHGWSEVHTIGDVSVIEKEINRVDKQTKAN